MNKYKYHFCANNMLWPIEITIWGNYIDFSLNMLFCQTKVLFGFLKIWYYLDALILIHGNLKNGLHLWGLWWWFDCSLKATDVIWMVLSFRLVCLQSWCVYCFAVVCLVEPVMTPSHLTRGSWPCGDTLTVHPRAHIDMHSTIGPAVEFHMFLWKPCRTPQPLATHTYRLARLRVRSYTLFNTEVRRSLTGHLIVSFLHMCTYAHEYGCVSE